MASGADNWVMVGQSGKAKEAWLAEQLGLQHGIPSHDTSGYLSAAIDPAQFNGCFSRRVADLVQLTEG